MASRESARTTGSRARTGPGTAAKATASSAGTHIIQCLLLFMRLPSPFHGKLKYC